MTALAPMASAFSTRRPDDDKMWLYTLHRMIRAQALPAVPARRQAGFDLDQAIAAGKADFGQGKLIDLELRVRGYPAMLVSVCPLSDSQRLRDEPEVSHAKNSGGHRLARRLLSLHIESEDFNLQG